MRLALALLLAFQVTLTPEAFGWPCPEDDDAGAPCESGCTDCASCGHSATGDGAVEVRSEVTVEAAPVPEREQRPAPSPDPRDILHVPIVRSA